MAGLVPQGGAYISGKIQKFSAPTKTPEHFPHHSLTISSTQPII